MDREQLDKNVQGVEKAYQENGTDGVTKFMRGMSKDDQVQVGHELETKNAQFAEQMNKEGKLVTRANCEYATDGSGKEVLTGITFNEPTMAQKIPVIGDYVGSPIARTAKIETPEERTVRLGGQAEKLISGTNPEILKPQG